MGRMGRNIFLLCCTVWLVLSSHQVAAFCPGALRLAKGERARSRSLATLYVGPMATAAPPAPAPAQTMAGRGAGDDETAWSTYDHEKIGEYFRSHPGDALSRAGKLVGFASSVGTSIALAALAGKRGAEILEGDVAKCISGVLAEAGPTFSKFGQALSCRPDLIGAPLAGELSSLQDAIPPFDNTEALEIVRQELLSGHEAHNSSSSSRSREVDELLQSIGSESIASASLGQVYRARVGGRDVAVKVLRPGVMADVAADSFLIRALCIIGEGIKNPFTGARVIKPALIDGCDEFFSRIFEEADYRHEAQNMVRFDSLYGEGGRYASVVQGVVVPRVIENLSGRRVLTMEWIEGVKLADGALVGAADLPLLRVGIACTLSQCLESGFMHADPHGGNLLKTSSSPPRLAYLDFGLVSEVPVEVREGLLRAVAHVVARDFTAVARLFEQLMLVPKGALDDPEEFERFRASLEAAAGQLLPPPEEGGQGGASSVPVLRFDRLLAELAPLAPRFEFTLPPYFLNNARAIGSLEGLAKTADPSFNLLAEVYSFSIRTLLTSDSPGMRKTLMDITYDPDTGKPSLRKVRALVKDAAMLSGIKKRRIIFDAVKSKGGRGFAWKVLGDRALLRKRRREGDAQDRHV